MAVTDEACTRLCDTEFEVSAHYLIGRSGRVIQMVREADRAWHAGAGSWQGQDDINSRSIGIELTNTGSEPFAEAQMTALIDLLRGVQTRWAIPPHRVIGHSDMAPGRKIDPGRSFPWDALSRAGLTIGPRDIARIQVDQMPPDTAAFAAAACRAGYPAASPESLLEAFRSRFAPARTGPLMPEDMADIARLAALLGSIDRPAPTA
ncbi:MAG: N-acetylmuramoyl-L-alanine amidase [Pseudomonadota bacterium]